MANGIINEKQTKVVPVDVSTAMSTGEILGWNGTKYTKAVGSADTTWGETTAGTTKIALGHGDVIHDTVTVYVGSTTAPTTIAYTVQYTTGSVTLAESTTKSGKVTYDYFAYEPSAVLLEDVTTGQSPAYALAELYGIAYNATTNDDIEARLERNGIYNSDRTTA